ncbi:endoglucanase E-4-like [Cylas formicarius]|uniref:endoglucanase E-4-like n=1 Tax=Cylas formicarius TaxID=197179 RepID=UPI0029585C99|nr:endoglucanase E-4-like [Cylas formicarius]
MSLLNAAHAFVWFLCVFCIAARVNIKPDYRLAIKYSLLFYEAQRSGKLPPDNRIKWRGDSATNDAGANGEDLSGGYYDGSDYVKFSYTMAYTMTILSWGLLAYENTYKNISLYNDTLDAIKWGTDYFLKCHVSSHELYGQVGDFTSDHAYWGRPEEMTMDRPAFKIDELHPGTDLAGQVSSALSSASIVFRHINQTYAQLLLNHSLELYDFAKEFRGLSVDVLPGAKEYYKFTSYGDELTWAAIWLYKATASERFLREAEDFFNQFLYTKKVTNMFFYNDLTIGNKLLLAESTGNPAYSHPVRDFCEKAVGDELKTPKGLIFVNKIGTLSHATNIAFVCLVAAELSDFPKEKYVDFAKTQIDYILGSTGRSYVVGYGVDYPKKPLHAASSCPDRPAACGWEFIHSSEPNPQILYGALVSGPDGNDYYEDLREDFLYNEVGLDFNSGFQNVLVGLVHHKVQEEK